MEPVFFKVPILAEESIKVEYWNHKHFLNPVHYHEECQLTYIIEGNGDLFVGSTVSKFQAGDAFLFGKNVPHVLRNGKKYFTHSSEIAARAISVFFKEDPFVFLPSKIPEAEMVAKLLKFSMHGIKITPEQAEGLYTELMRLSALNPFEKVLSFQMILDRISRCKHLNLISLTSSSPLHAAALDSSKINVVFKYITENYNKPITLSEVASLAHMTPNAFCRYFKSHTKKTFSRFLVEVRIGVARKLLANGKCNSKESCYETGFNSVSNFNRHFKNVTGMTPSEYKKSISEN